MRTLLVSLVVLSAVFSIYPNASAQVTLSGPLGSVTEKFFSPKIERVSLTAKTAQANFPEQEVAKKVVSEGMKDTLNHLNAVRYMMSCA